MRILLALLALMTMLAGPVVAAAKVDCRVAMQQTASYMDRPAMAGMDMTPAKAVAASPCCDPGSKHKPSDRGCAQMCAALNAVAITISLEVFAAPLVTTALVLTPPQPAPGRAFEPLGLKRPPKRIV